MEPARRVGPSLTIPRRGTVARPGGRAGRTGGLRVFSKNPQNLARFKDARKTASLGNAIFEPHIGRRKSLHRKAFDELAKRPEIQLSRDDWHIFEPWTNARNSYAQAFFSPRAWYLSELAYMSEEVV